MGEGRVRDVLVPCEPESTCRANERCDTEESRGVDEEARCHFGGFLSVQRGYML